MTTKRVLTVLASIAAVVALIAPPAQSIGTFVPREVAALANAGVFGFDIDDVDLDGHLDILSASPGDDSVRWHRSNGASPPSWSTQVITDELQAPTSVQAGDLNEDGIVDIAVASCDDDRMLWFESDGADPAAWTPHDISTTHDCPVALRPVDIDGDADLDLVGAILIGDVVLWFENDGSGSFTAHDISTTADGPIEVVTADIDDDGDPDVVAALRNGNTIRWYENEGGSPLSFHAGRDVTAAAAPWSVQVADVDSDGLMDVLVPEENTDVLSWYENSGGSPPAWTDHVISDAINFPRGSVASDFDYDGDMDVAANAMSAGQTLLYESDGATPPAWTPHVVDTKTSPIGIGTGDLDGDGAIDLAAGSRHSVDWYENPIELPSVSVTDVAPIKEGRKNRTRPFVFVVSVTPDSTVPVTVTVETSHGTTSPDDFVALPPTDIVFDPGQSHESVVVTVIGDNRKEKGETFHLNVIAATNATIADGVGTATIANDDRRRR